MFEKKSYLVFIICCLIFCRNAFAAPAPIDTVSGWKHYYGIAGADTGSYYQIGSCKFFEYDDYVIIEKDLNREIGSNIYIKTKKGGQIEINCEKIIRQNDMRILNEWAEFFFAKKGDCVFIRSGTGERCNLIIYDIIKKQKIFQTDFSDTIRFVAKNRICFWTETSVAEKGSCPEYEKLSHLGVIPIIETKVTLDLSNLVVIWTPEKKCSYKKE